MKKKKIVIAMNNLAVGGAQHQLIRQLPHFNTDAYEIHVMLLVHDDARATLLDRVPKNIFVHTFSFYSFIDVSSWLSLYKTLRTIQPHLVISSMFFSNTILRILKVFIGYPIISREHNTYTEKTFMQIQTDRLLALWTKKIVTVSKEVADFTSAQEHISRDKFLVIDNGIDIESIDAQKSSIDADAVRSELVILPETKVLLHVGRMIDQKNQSLLIEGFAEFLKEKSNWVLVMVGGGADYDLLKALVDTLGISQSVIMVGEKANVHPYYMIGDCFITTSLIEGMSNTHLEALAHGLPIVSTPTGGTGRVIEEGKSGYIIPDYNKESAAATLSKVALGNIEQMKVSARKHGETFDIKKTVEQYEELFEAYFT